MIRKILGICIAVAPVLTMASALAQGQLSLADSPQRSASKPPAVEYLDPDEVTVRAGKPTTIALHFRIAPGLHINSHTPNDEDLIPTTLSIPEASAVRLASAVFPPGTEFSLPFDPTMKLSVYTGEFTVQARIVAPAGAHLVEASLRYQACDNNICMPPKTVSAAINVIGK
ncbi:MAG: protein-disulfide reductase DsbD N-terminal domain-containing protein [Terracidiphilus sp.]